jgi:WhiB family redox-sensing transcriptional regulator
VLALLGAALRPRLVPAPLHALALQRFPGVPEPEGRVDEAPPKDGELLTGAKRFDLLITTSLDWKERGACVGADEELFFPPARRTDARRPRPETDDTREAKRICGTCRVRDECRDYALDRPEPEGIWGGLTEDERWDILDRRAGR